MMLCHHYEIHGEKLDNFLRDAKAPRIETKYYPADRKVKIINNDGHYVFLCNGGG